MIRILIADDHTLVREGLKQILSDLPDMAVTEEASNGKEVLDKIRESDFDVVLLDISMPGQSGVDILKQIKLLKPKLPVLILSMYPEEQYAIRTLRAGAAGYLTKDSVPDELIEALRTVSLGKKYITFSLAEKLAYDWDENMKRLPHEKLSDREFQVMLMIAAGKAIQEIADEMCLSINTISTYRKRILEKMKMAKKQEKMRKQLAKQGRTLPDEMKAGEKPAAGAKEGEGKIAQAEVVEFKSKEWERKSVQSLDEIEKKIDRFSGKGVKGLEERYREKYGEDLANAVLVRDRRGCYRVLSSADLLGSLDGGQVRAVALAPILAAIRIEARRAGIELEVA